MMIFVLLSVITFISTRVAGAHIGSSSPLQDILDQAGQGNYTYPTSFTQGIIPKPIHSHNDYWRPVPFYSALSVGAVSVEADVWLMDGSLYVGHELGSLTATRTLESLYIQPILKVLHAQNPSTKFVTTATKNGVFDTASDQTLYLWIDIKTDGPSTWPIVVKALQPLRDAGYLTTYDGSAVIPGAVTVIGTGTTPLKQIQGVSPRDYFFDGALTTLDTSNITKEVSPIASTDFAAVFGEIRNQTFTESQLSTLKNQIAVAKGKGIGVRYWDIPAWPIHTRDSIWQTLWAHGVSLINADDIWAAATF